MSNQIDVRIEEIKQLVSLHNKKSGDNSSLNTIFLSKLRNKILHLLKNLLSLGKGNISIAIYKVDNNTYKEQFINLSESDVRKILELRKSLFQLENRDLEIIEISSSQTSIIEL